MSNVRYSLGEELKKFPTAAEKDSKETSAKSKRVISLKGGSSTLIKEKLEGGLKSSRPGEKDNTARLVQQALGSVQQPKKRQADDGNAGGKGRNQQVYNRDSGNGIKRHRNSGEVEGGFVSSSARRREQGQQQQQQQPPRQMQQGGIPFNQVLFTHGAVA